MLNKTLDGFPIQDNFNFLSDRTDINQWSHKTKVVININDDYLIGLEKGSYKKTVIWQGVAIVLADYEWFTELIKQWMDNKFNPLTKEQALNEYFEIYNHKAKEAS